MPPPQPGWIEGKVLGGGARPAARRWKSSFQNKRTRRGGQQTQAHAALRTRGAACHAQHHEPTHEHQPARTCRVGRNRNKLPPPKKNQCNYSELKSSLEKRVGDACDTASPVRRPRVRCVRAAGPRAATPCGGVHSFPHEREGGHTEVTGEVSMASQGLRGRQLSSSGSPSSCPSQSCLRRREHTHKDNPSTGRSRPPGPLWTRACLRSTLTSYQI